MSTDETVTSFFDDYARALTDRDERAVGALYAVPALIVFPGQTLLVTSQQQTEEFFASSWPQYEGVSQAAAEVDVLASTDHSVWASVTWRHDGEPREEFVYQLVRGEAGWRIGVLTPTG